MRPLLRTLARLGAACLTVAASMPGQLELVHRHAGGEHAHVHPDAAALAAHALLDDHHHHAPEGGHSHADPQVAHHHEHPPASQAASQGPDLWAVGAFHVHGLHPFQQATCGMVSCDASSTAVASASVTVASAPRAAPLRGARPRGPPMNLVG